MNAFEAAAADGKEAAAAGRAGGLFNEANTSPDRGATSIPATYLRVTVET